MTRIFSVAESIVIHADAQRIYEHVSDVQQMGRWSPENRGATVASDQTVPHVGMTFDGHNVRGKARWTTRCTVTVADPGAKFAFRVHSIGLKTPRLRGPIATWEYRFEESDGSTRVTESWHDDRTAWPTPVANAFDKVVTGGKTFAEFQRGNIGRTLANLKVALE